MPSLHEEGLGSGCCFASYCIRESRNWRAPLNWTADRGTPTPSLLQSLLLLHVGPRSDHLQLMSPSQTINGQTNYPLTTVMRLLIFIFSFFFIRDNTTACIRIMLGFSILQLHSSQTIRKGGINRKLTKKVKRRANTQKQSTPPCNFLSIITSVTIDTSTPPLHSHCFTTGILPALSC